mmetsp:Transcript_17057/g.40654  ORF Transcript_17057/g.40654 Transcript_17057/m.40654 type:complete len:204 (+) Transcript_17057:641-1252(+)
MEAVVDRAGRHRRLALHSVPAAAQDLGGRALGAAQALDQLGPRILQDLDELPGRAQDEPQERVHRQLGRDAAAHPGVHHLRHRRLLQDVRARYHGGAQRLHARAAQLPAQARPHGRGCRACGACGGDRKVIKLLDGGLLSRPLRPRTLSSRAPVLYQHTSHTHAINARARVHTHTYTPTHSPRSAHHHIDSHPASAVGGPEQR